MASLDMTSFDAALKQYYTDQRVENMVYQDNALLAIIPKMERFYGKVLPIVIQYGTTQGGSADFTTAKANKVASKYKDFLLTRVKDYQLASIDNETLEASQEDAGSFLDAATSEIDSAIHSATRSLAIAMYRTASGSIGQISAGQNVALSVITLADPESVTNFEVGMTLSADSADGGGTVGVTSRAVTAIDRDAGTVTVASALNSGTAWAASDYLFRAGDYDEKMSGLLDWIPSTAPTSTPFFGVDRSSDVSRLGGIRFDGSALPIEEALIKAANRAAREGAKPDYCFLSFSKFSDLVNALGSKVSIVELKVNPTIGFQAVMIQGPRGLIKVVPDQNCPNDRAFMLEMKTWKLYSLKKPVRILDQDGMKWLRESDSDGVEVRVGGYYQLGCQAPGKNVNIKLA